MSSRIEELFAALSPPKRGEVYAVDTSTTQADLDLDAKVGAVQRYWRGRMLTIQVSGADLMVAMIARSGDTIDSTANGEAGVPHANSCAVIPAGEERTFFVGGNGAPLRYLAWKTTSGTGRVRIFAASPKEGMGGP